MIGWRKRPMLSALAIMGGNGELAHATLDPRLFARGGRRGALRAQHP